MATFEKRQKEMKRLEKQRAKAEKRAQRKIAKSLGLETPAETTADDNGFSDLPAEENATEALGDETRVPD